MAEQQGITKISVQGFKSLYEKAEVEIRPLTVLAGANSSGKSSIMQPLLLMKQTLEAEYEPDIFLLDGPNVRFTNPEQFFSLSHDACIHERPIFSVYFDVASLGTLTTQYSLINQKMNIEETSFHNTNGSNFKTRTGEPLNRFSLRKDMAFEDLEAQTPVELEKVREALQAMWVDRNVLWTSSIYRCFLNIGMIFDDGSPAMQGDPVPYFFFPVATFSHYIQEIIHVSGLRDNPQRNYPIASLEGNFKGTFDNYFASVIAQSFFAPANETNILSKLSSNLIDLELSSGISTSQRASRIEIEVPHAFSGHTINIADVGLGVSQVLPVLVALLVAKVGQLVYIEQPELHLHPRAQVKLAQILADAANRGVRVVVETHSSLLLLGLQTLIAEAKLKNTDMILHWFTRDEAGKTTIDSQTPDENGAYGDWPQDFGDIRLETQSRYLEAVEKRLSEQVSGD